MMNTPLIRANTRFTNTPWEISENARIVSLICLLGIALSAAILPHVPTDELRWVFTHLE
jgi:hypothetical protein